MFSNAEDSATAGVIALLLEVSSNPKSGNVDREHNLKDLTYENFLISSASAFPAFLKLAKRQISIGEGVLSAINNSKRFQSTNNVHFGAFLLLAPLIHSWGDVGKAVNAIKSTTYNDSIQILRAFKLVKARVMDTENLSLKSDETEKMIIEERINLYKWMKLAPPENIIAKELIDGYKMTIMAKTFLFKFLELYGNINKAIVVTYHKLLSEVIDPLIIAKHGIKKAEMIRKTAEKTFKLFIETGKFDLFHRLDEELLKMNANPGSIADIISSSIYLALAEGLRI